MKQINFNGQLRPQSTPILFPSNRAFRYGDGLFESIRMFDGQLPFLDYHYERLYKGMYFLGYNIPKYFSPLFFQNEIKKLTQNKLNCRIRLTVFRSDGGLYTPTDNTPVFIIEAVSLTENRFTVNEEGLKIGWYKKTKIPLTPLSALKTCNALPYILAAQYCKKNQLDDCLMLNTEDRIAESYKANVFFIGTSKIFTPAADEGCIEGVMRRVVIELLKDMEQEVLECPISVDMVADAQAILLTNATRGGEWVECLGDEQTYQRHLIDKLIGRLNDLL